RPLGAAGAALGRGRDADHGGGRQVPGHGAARRRLPRHAGQRRLPGGEGARRPRRRRLNPARPWPRARAASPTPPGRPGGPRRRTIAPAPLDAMAPRRLSLLSFNIQAGATTRRYREYVTRGWTHVLPAKAKRGNLDNIARVASEFDVVGLQEADPGSLRSSFLNQTHYLAEQAAFPYWSHQANRRVGGIARSANGLLSRIEPVEVQLPALPSRFPGRGALVVRYGPELDPLVVVIAHLSLSIKARIPQLAYIADLVSDAPNAV